MPSVDFGPSATHRFSATPGANLVPAQDASIQASLVPRALDQVWPCSPSGAGRAAQGPGDAVLAPVEPPYARRFLLQPPGADQGGSPGEGDDGEVPRVWAKQDRLVLSYALPGTDITLDVEVSGHELFDDQRAVAEGAMPMWQVERTAWHAGRAAHVAAPSRYVCWWLNAGSLLPASTLCLSGGCRARARARTLTHTHRLLWHD